MITTIDLVDQLAWWRRSASLAESGRLRITCVHRSESSEFEVDARLKTRPKNFPSESAWRDLRRIAATRALRSQTRTLITARDHHLGPLSFWVERING